MAGKSPRYSPEEFARRGDEIYVREIQPRLNSEDRGKYIAIDIETGAYEIDADEDRASDRLDARLPGAQTWMKRIGYKHIRRFGGAAGRSCND